MDIFGVLNMGGGLALFLYGMSLMGDGLSNASGGRMETFLEKLTSNKIKAVLLGAGVTAVIQSSCNWSAFSLPPTAKITDYILVSQCSNLTPSSILSNVPFVL